MDTDAPHFSAIPNFHIEHRFVLQLAFWRERWQIEISTMNANKYSIKQREQLYRLMIR